MKFVRVSGIRNLVISGMLFFVLFCPATGNALPSVPVLVSVFSSDFSRPTAAVNHSFPFAPEITIRRLEGLPYRTASNALGGFPAAVTVEGMSRGYSAGTEPKMNDRLFDMLIPLFIGSMLIGFAGIIRKFGTSPEPIEKFARMGAASPYKKAVSS